MPPQLVAFCSENSVLILLIVVVDFTYKVLLSLGVVFQVNTILPKIRSPFHIFKKRYFRNSGLFSWERSRAVEEKPANLP